jgi:glycosyltransferase involved in cell wall biosynthesis
MVAERDADELAEACEKLLSDSQLCHQLTRNGRRLIEDRFDIDKNTAKIRAFFSSVTEVDLKPGMGRGDK